MDGRLAVWLDPVQALVDALSDPLRRRRVALALVAAYGLAWFLYGVLAKSSQDLNADMAEMAIWAREPALSYPKHPPFLAWVVTAWFTIFPSHDWAFILLAVVSVSVGLYLAFELAGEWLEAEKRAAVLFLLAVIPFYNLLALKFDHNSALIPLWALTIWAFMRSLETPSAKWAVITGLAALAAVLTKYWSVILLFALAIAAITDPRRRRYFASPAPWIAAAIVVIGFAPHLMALAAEDFAPLKFAASRRRAETVLDALRSLGEYLGGTAGYAAGAILLVLVFARLSLAAVKDSWLPPEPARRTAAIIFWVPILLPIALALPRGTALLSLWNMPALSLLPVMLLASPLVLLGREATARMAAAAIAVTAILVVVSPVIAAVIHMRGVENNSAYARLVGQEAARVWSARTGKPLKLLAGPFTLVNTAAFYLPDRPSTYADFLPYLSPWVTQERITRDGMATVCPVDDAHCAKLMTQWLAGERAAPVPVELSRSWLGIAGKPKRFLIGVVPPGASIGSPDNFDKLPQR
jgi:4-amino-4-deoxy-L-arabinose transferase-like glycosyltransferase